MIPKVKWIDRTATAAITTALLFVACSSDHRTAGIDRGGARTPVAASGPITAFGSIFVNGVRYELDSAQIDVNGAIATQADLALGQVVRVAGLLDASGTTATAETVAFDANVTGPVDSIDVAAMTFEVLGQTIIVDAASTVLDFEPLPAEIDSLAAGDFVEVSGFAGANGSILATRVELESAGPLRLRGVVTNLDLGGLTFSINGFSVDYGSAAIVEDFPNGQPSNGDEVSVIGASIDPSGALVADELRRFEFASGSSGEEAEVEGLITRFVSEFDFDVDGVAVTTSGATEYEGGTAADLALNVKVQAEGLFAAGGTIDADKIEVKDGGRVYD
jgi:hypothetical protein